jgi:ACS family pantothenate transporter-like MFS transporter
MYALRFFIGLLESCAFPGYIAILGSWYGPQELAKRTAVLLEVESIASMFSGYLQAGLHSSMNGHAGLAGWQWLFIMDGVISIPIALWGFFGLPDMPHDTRAFYWSPEVSQSKLSDMVLSQLTTSSTFATALNESRSSARKPKTD